MATIRAVIASHRDGVAEMISKYEIVAVATQASLQTHVIEKDYALGWLLAGISQSAAINSTWVFKGGTCLKKCYFETYRFSEDLDFTLRDPTHINDEFLHATFAEISNWIYEQSGLEIPADRMKFEVYTNPRGVASCQGRVYYKGPATFSGKHSMPRIKLDLSSDEILVDPPVIIPVRHDYSDRPASGFSVQAYSYAEVFAEKIRALKERTRPRDLYDVMLEGVTAALKDAQGRPSLRSLGVTTNNRNDYEHLWQSILNLVLRQLKGIGARIFRGVVGFARIPRSGIGTNGILANPTTLKLVYSRSRSSREHAADNQGADDFAADLGTSDNLFDCSRDAEPAINGERPTLRGCVCSWNGR